MAAAIYISYRRQDSGATAKSIYSALALNFGRGNVFLDAESIPVGVNYQEVINTALRDAETILVLISEDYFKTLDQDGNRRIDDPNDYVRREVETALSENKTVIPVLIDAQFPREEELPPPIRRLAHLQAIPIRSESLDQDIDRLVIGIARIIGKPITPHPAAPSPMQKLERRRNRLIPLGFISLAALMVIAVLVIPALLSPSTPPSTFIGTDVAFVGTETALAIITHTPEELGENDATRTADAALAATNAVQIIATDVPPIFASVTALVQGATETAARYTEVAGGVIVTPGAPTSTPDGSGISSVGISGSTTPYLLVIALALIILGSVVTVVFVSSRRPPHVEVRPITETGLSAVAPVSVEKHSAFLSYQRRAGVMVVAWLSEGLHKRNIEAFYDGEMSGVPGHFPSRLVSEIKQCDVFVCVLADTTLQSEWVIKEIQEAYSQKKPMIPVFLESFHTPNDETLSDKAIKSLLENQGEFLLDQRGIHLDYSMNNIARMIQAFASA